MNCRHVATPIDIKITEKASPNLYSIEKLVQILTQWWSKIKAYLSTPNGEDFRADPYGCTGTFRPPNIGF